jgi:hypothetical protein
VKARERLIRDLGAVCLEAGWSDVPGDLGDLIDGLTRAGWRPPRNPAEIQVMCPECRRGYHVNHPERPDLGACSDGACDCDWMDPYGVVRTGRLPATMVPTDEPGGPW